MADQVNGEENTYYSYIWMALVVYTLETLVFIVGQRLTACRMVPASAFIAHEIRISVQVLFHLVLARHVLVQNALCRRL